ncbi:MAG TPA: phosphatase PAP2 family protein [Acidiferrobacterales bacterium]|nr:phosphatase PAP2 family protein [Acidiferrobacterales bacterium]
MSQKTFAPLHKRLVVVTLAFFALALAGLGLALVYGDAGSVAQVHYAAWTQEHYAFLRVFTNYGLYPFYILFLVLLAWGWYRRAPGLKLIAQGYFLAQLLGSVLIVRVLKMTLGRARPDATPLPDFGSEWAGFSWDAAHHSFPSGHTADIVISTLFAALLLRNPWAVAVCLAWAGALALSRLALAKHYPSDALAGAVIAVAASLVVLRYWLLPRLAHLPGSGAMGWWRESNR